MFKSNARNKFHIVMVVMLLWVHPAHAQTLFSGMKQDNNKPIDIQADDLVVQPNSQTATFKGNVIATQDNLSMQSSVMRVFYKDQKAAENNAVSRIETEGKVKIQVDDRIATANKGFYDVEKATMELRGDVILKRGENELNGDVFTYNTATGKSQLVGAPAASKKTADGTVEAPKGRVRARLVPESIPKKESGSKNAE